MRNSFLFCFEIFFFIFLFFSKPLATYIHQTKKLGQRTTYDHYICLYKNKFLFSYTTNEKKK